MSGRARRMPVDRPIQIQRSEICGLHECERGRRRDACLARTRTPHRSVQKRCRGQGRWHVEAHAWLPHKVFVVHGTRPRGAHVRFELPCKMASNRRKTAQLASVTGLPRYLGSRLYRGHRKLCGNRQRYALGLSIHRPGLVFSGHWASLIEYESRLRCHVGPTRRAVARTFRSSTIFVRPYEPVESWHGSKGSELVLTLAAGRNALVVRSGAVESCRRIQNWLPADRRWIISSCLLGPISGAVELLGAIGVIASLIYLSRQFAKHAGHTRIGTAQRGRR